MAYNRRKKISAGGLYFMLVASFLLTRHVSCEGVDRN